ncbi:MAG: glycosyltransferase [Azospirillum sp.]|nr:glycosyltransferase [Azospirillum sp.]
MKILHVMAGGQYGGAETMFVDCLTALNEAGVEQAVVTRPSELRDAVWQKLGLPVRHAAFPMVLGGPTRAAIDGALEDFKPDIAQFWMARAASYACAGPVPNIGWFGGYYDLKYYRNCQYHVGVTYDLARHIVANGGHPDTTAVIHTFADLEPAPPVERAEFDTPEGVPLLLALARLHASKALDILLQALVKIPGAYLWIAGDGPLRGVMASYAERLGVAPRVRFLGWRTDRAALLAAADLCVFPSRIEPFGTVMVEAWAAGVPLIAAAAAGPLAYVRPDVNGLLVAIDDAEGLARAVERCLGDRDLCARLVEGGRTTYRETFTKQVLVRDSLAFYGKVLNGG